MSKSKAKCWSCGDTGSSAIRDADGREVDSFQCPYCEEIELADLRAKLAAAIERAEKAELAVQEQRLLTETVRAGMHQLGRALEDCRLDKHAVEVERDRMSKCVTDAIARAEAAEAERDQVMDLILRAEGIGPEGELGISAEKVHELFHSEQHLAAARAGEARALALLEKAHKTNAWLVAEETTPFPDQEHYSGGDYLIALQSPALDWLDQQRRAAVADWLEQNNERLDAMNRADVAEEAAELRKGKGE